MRELRRIGPPLSLAVFVALFAGIACVAPRSRARVEITGEALLADIRYLADDALEGRLTGTKGCDEAARFIAERFRSLELEPGGDAGSWLQHFDAVSGRQVQPTTSAKVGDRALSPAREFTVVNGTGTCEAKGELCFVGYGLDSNAANRHDYASDAIKGLVKGRIAVALMGAPGRASGQGDFLDTKPGGEAVKARRKVQAAFAAEASGLILINETAKDGDALPSFDEGLGDGLTFPAIHVTAAFGRELLKSGGVDLDAALRSLEAGDTVAAPLANGSATLHVDTAPIHRSTANVVAILRGDGSHGQEHLIVGGHYDHLGRGGGASLAPGVHEIHNGADDNASGTAAVLALAQWSATRRDRPARTLVFIAFSGEELGLLGSQHYTKHPVLPLDQCVAMLNLDMVGRSLNHYCAVGAIGSAANFKGIAEKENAELHLGLELTLADGGMAAGSSDHQSFLNAKVPSLFFFSGLHADYHKPSDDVDKINADGAACITKLCGAILEELEVASPRPAFVETAAPPANPHVANGANAAAPTNERRAAAEARPWFGSIPAFGASGDGVLFDGVTVGSPAEKAGVQKGDRLVEWNARAIKTLEDFTAVLSSCKVGDTVKIAVLRGETRKEFEVTLAVRP